MSIVSIPDAEAKYAAKYGNDAVLLLRACARSEFQSQFLPLCEQLEILKKGEEVSRKTTYEQDLIRNTVHPCLYQVYEMHAPSERYKYDAGGEAREKAALDLIVSYVNKLQYPVGPIDRKRRYITFKPEDAVKIAEITERNITELSGKLDAEAGPCLFGDGWKDAIGVILWAYSVNGTNTLQRLRSGFTTEVATDLVLLSYLHSTISAPLPFDATFARYHTIADRRALEDLKELQRLGLPFMTKGFFSMSYSEEYLDTELARRKENKRFLFVINLPRGFPVLTLIKHSYYKDTEGEILLPFNIPMRITDIDEKTRHVFIRPFSNFDPAARNPYGALSKGAQLKTFARHFSWNAVNYRFSNENESEFKDLYPESTPADENAREPEMKAFFHSMCGADCIA